METQKNELINLTLTAYLQMLNKLLICCRRSNINYNIVAVFSLLDDLDKKANK